MRERRFDLIQPPSLRWEHCPLSRLRCPTCYEQVSSSFFSCFLILSEHDNSINKSKNTDKCSGSSSDNVFVCVTVLNEHASKNRCKCGDEFFNPILHDMKRYNLKNCSTNLKNRNVCGIIKKFQSCHDVYGKGITKIT